MEKEIRQAIDHLDELIAKDKAEAQQWEKEHPAMHRASLQANWGDPSSGQYWQRELKFWEGVRRDAKLNGDTVSYTRASQGKRIASNVIKEKLRGTR